MTTLPNMSLVLPTRGAGGAGIWDDAIDAALGLVDEHNHTSGRGLRVPTTGININADLTFSSLYAPTNLHRISFASVAALVANNKSLFVSSADNELYWRSNAGTNVKLTSGSSLNVAAFTGGFGGDYVSAGAAAAFDDANKNYTFKSSGSAWARATFGGIRLIEFGTTETVRVGLLCPAGLGASYDVTFPTALPAVTKPLQISSAGVISVGLPLQVHPISLGVFGTGVTYAAGTAGSGARANFGTAVTVSNLPILVYSGLTITEWSVALDKNTSSAATITAKLWRNGVSGGATQIGATQTNSANGVGPSTIGQSGLTEVVTTLGYFIEIVGSGTTGDSMFDYTVTTS